MNLHYMGCHLDIFDIALINKYIISRMKSRDVCSTYFNLFLYQKGKLNLVGGSFGNLVYN